MRLVDRFKYYQDKTVEIELNTATTLYGTVLEAHEDHVVIEDRGKVSYIVVYNSIVHFYEIPPSGGSFASGTG
jgi:hypothetical protein